MATFGGASDVPDRHVSTHVSINYNQYPDGGFPDLSEVFTSVEPQRNSRIRDGFVDLRSLKIP